MVSFRLKGGAGLGFIEMAKTAGNKLEYTFKELKGEFFTVYLQGGSRSLNGVFHFVQIQSVSGHHLPTGRSNAFPYIFY